MIFPARNDLKLLEFEDTLAIYSLAGQEIGEFSISVTAAIHKRESCFRVRAKSVAVLDEVPCGTEINAIVNERLETIEQDQHEYIKVKQSRVLTAHY